jgi:alpha-1,2-mannosyltransferase
MPATVDRRPSLLATVNRVTRQVGSATSVRLGIIAATALVAVWAVRAFGRQYDFFDLRIYHGAVAWWAEGGDLYQFVAPRTMLGFTYPPFAALAMLPMAALSAQAAGWVNALAGLVALAMILFAILGPIADRYGWPRWFAVGIAVPLAGATEPVRETIGFGQVNLILAGLIIADLVALRWRGRATVATATMARGTAAVDAGAPSAPRSPLAWLRDAWLTGAFAGVGVGVATSVKLTPGLFILYFLITRQWRTAFTAIGAATGATLFGYLCAGRESAAYFGSVIWDTNRVGVVDATPNQSLAGLLARAYDSPVTPGLMWLAFAVLLLAVGLSRAKTAHAEGDELAAFTLVGLTANAICPISWTHHFVFLVPAVVILVDTALRRRRAVRGFNIGRFPALAGLRHISAAVGLYLLIVVSPMWRYEHKLPQMSHYADGRFGALMENSLALAVIVLVALLPWRQGAEPVFEAESASRVRARASL